jgi:cysteinyl-tRNA synthetase
MEKLRIYNTISRKKEVFEPRRPGRVGMYVCGVTVYGYCHLGHARCYVAFDVIHRYLRYLGYRVDYVQNITDLDDKLINLARGEGGEEGIKERVARIAERFTEAYFADMDRLNILRAGRYPRATGNIDAMTEMITTLIEKGYAYREGGNVYYAVDKFKGYGELSHRRLEEMKAGARVEVSRRKRNPFDFALWKEAAPAEPTWPSPWGPGRPGWHIECSAMSTRYLGDTFDIHGGGQDLIFPHHENERAQAEAATGRVFARFWVHNGFVTVNREKMSKSLGNVFNLRDIFKSYQPRVVRFFLLGQHYRSPVDYSDTALQEAKQALFRLDNCYGLGREVWVDLDSAGADGKMMDEFEGAMNDDFNTAAALSVAYKAAEEFYRVYRKPALPEGVKAQLAAMKKICSLLGIELVNPIHGLTREALKKEISEYPALAGRIIKEDRLTEGNIETLLICREKAREDKDWALADRIRDYFKEKEITVMDRAGAPSAAVYYPEQIGE